MNVNPKLEILLLGTPAVYYAGEPIQIKRLILRSLLFFLAYKRRLVARNRLILTFWPDASEEDGRRHLREVLSKLRSQLPEGDLLITDQDRVGLNFSKCRVDAQEFIELVGRTKLALQLNTDPLLHTAIFQDVLRALHLWRSSHFMAGANLPKSDEYEKWIMDSRLEMENLRHYLVVKIAEHYLASNDLIESLRWFRAAVQHNDLDVDLHMHIMTVLQRLGQTQEALNHYGRLADLYLQEGMGDLPPVAMQLYTNLVKGTNRVAPTSSIQWPSNLNLQVTFTGRKEILINLSTSFHAGGTVVLYGEAGGGKTRLLYELYKSLQPQPRLLLTGGQLMEITIPFQPWIDLFRRIMTPQDWQQVDATWLEPLAILLPELQQLGINEPIKKSFLPDQGRSYFFEAIHQVLLYLAREERMFICFDDAQWCDEASFAAMSYLQTRGFFDKHGFLIISCHLGESPPSLEEFRKIQPHPSNMKIIHLPPLEKDDVQNICQSMLGFIPSEDFIVRITADSGGNPLFLLETLRGIQQMNLDKGQLEKIIDFPIPPSIGTLIHNRWMSQLRAETRQVLVMAAVFGNYINTNDIARATDQNLESVVNALEELEEMHIIQPIRGSMTGTDYIFIHEKIRRMLVKELSPARRKLLHRNAGLMLEEKYGGLPQMAAVLANHFQEAGEGVKACHYWVQAGIHADRLLSPGQALDAYRNAERLVDQNENLIPDDLVYQLFNAILNNFSASSNFRLQQSYARKLLRLGARRSSALLIGSALSNLGATEGQLVGALKGIAFLTDALVYIDQTDNLKEKAEASNRLGLLYQLSLQFDLARKQFQKSLKIVAHAADRRLVESRINANTQLCFLNYFLALPEKVDHHADLVLRDCQLIGNVSSAGKAYFLKSYANLVQEKYEDCISQAKRGLDILQALNSRQFIGYSHLALAEAFFKKGEIDASWQENQWIFDEIKPGEYDDVLAEAYATLGAFYLSMAAYEPARQILQSSLDRFKHLTQKFQMQVRLAHALAGIGRLDHGMQLIDATIDETERLSLYLALLPARMCRGYLFTQCHEYQKAKIDLEWVRDEGIKRSLPTYNGYADCFLGELSILQDQFEEAYEYAQKFSHRLIKVHNPWLEITCLRLKNRAIHGMGEVDPSIPLHIRKRLEDLSSKCTIPELRPHFASFKSQILAEL